MSLHWLFGVRPDGTVLALGRHVQEHGARADSGEAVLDYPTLDAAVAMAKSTHAAYRVFELPASPTISRDPPTPESL